MYVRPPSQNSSQMKLPDNYKGNAFSQQYQYSDMPPAAHTPHRNTDIPRSEFIPPTFDSKHDDMEPDIRKQNEQRHEYEKDIYEAVPVYKEQNGFPPSEISESEKPKGSIFSSLLPGIDIGNHFPFGHGLGGEELLILAVMLLVYLSGNENGKTDNEFILLLGLLLFAG